MITQNDCFADAHTHIQDFSDIPLILQQSAEANIKYIVVNSTDMSYLPPLLQSSTTDCKIIPCIGLHPWFIPEELDEETYFQPMEELLHHNQHVQVGEIGLDYMKAQSKEQRQLQLRLFRRQMQLSHTHERTMSVHCVRAHGEMLKEFKKFFAAHPTYAQSIIMHSWGGSADIMAAMDKMYGNFYYSLCMSVARAPERVAHINIDKLLFETDAPHQFDARIFAAGTEPPLKIWNTNHASEPRFIDDLVQFVAPHLQIDAKQLQQIVFSNFIRAFKKFI